MKTCYRCNETKCLSEFHVLKKSKDGVRGMCKPCSIKDIQDRQKTPRGLIKKIYHNQKMITGKNGRPAPTYTEEELFQWAKANSLRELWYAWRDSGYAKDLSPSCDRLDNDISYTLDNIQLVTWRENLLNQKNMNIAGTLIHTGSKSVDMHDLEGVYLKTFPSVACAMREVLGKRGTVSNISNVAEGKWKSAYGYTWRWTPALS